MVFMNACGIVGKYSKIFEEIIIRDLRDGRKLRDLRNSRDLRDLRNQSTQVLK